MGSDRDGSNSAPSVRPLEFGEASRALLGISIFLLLVLVRVGPTILAQPNVFGAYWAYVFPVSTLATAAILNADG